MQKYFISRVTGFPHWLVAIALCLGAFSAPMHGSLTDQLEAVLDQTMAESDVPGIIMGVWRGDTEIAVFEKGVSNVDTQQQINRLQSVRMASVTKSLTVTRVLQLHQTGQLSLDDPISNYVPDLQNGNATLRQLANMTSGIFNYTEDQDLVMELVTNPTKVWTDQQLVDAANAEIHEPYFAPGAGWHYSNTNTVLLGMVIEAVTGNFYADEIVDHITQPLGLDHTLYPDGDFPPAPYVDGYANFGEGPALFTEASPTVTSAAGSFVSKLDDLRIWARALAEGTLLTPELQEERLEMIDLPEGVAPEYDSYGLGIGSLDGWLGHTGDFPGYQSLIMYDLIHDQTVVILLNLTGEGHLPTDIFREISPILAIPEPSAAFLVVFIGVAVLWLRRGRRGA